ncbi:MAG: Ni/Fe-hydrogenase, b-type cytochrome subunit [bacterium]|nr:Ni/Fe-hydrogenase, b-type cytochrome subunit [bacterium]
MSSMAAGAIRYADQEPLVNVYVWEWPVRLTHWLNAISIWVLSVTGVYMGFPFLLATGEASQHFLMGWAKLIHFYAAIVFTLSVLSRILWMFRGNRFASWRYFLPWGKVRWKAMGPTLGYYLFRLRTPPGIVGHNPLAGFTYAIVFLMFLAQIGTGMAIYAASASYDSPVKVFELLIPVFGGLQDARWIHHMVMWLIWAFFVQHVYSAILMSQVEPTATMESIFSGHKFVPKDDVVEPGSRFYAEVAKRRKTWRSPKEG